MWLQRPFGNVSSLCIKLQHKSSVSIEYIRIFKSVSGNAPSLPQTTAMESWEWGGNVTLMTEFVLVGFTIVPRLRVTFFVLFLFSYILTLMGNVSLMTLIFLESRLHTPMYFFVGNLSLLDMWYSTVYIPRILTDCMSKSNVISYAGCAAQFFFSTCLCFTECYLLAAMAYDRYAAICNPLLYSLTMTRKFCIQLVAGSYVTGFASDIIHTGNTFCLHFCGDNRINHFFCDVPPLMKMACENTQGYQLILSAAVGSNVVATTTLILGSYTGIVVAILHIRSASSRHKAFSTCSAHLISVSLFYGSLLFMYLQPSSLHTPDRDKVTALFCTVVNPLVNLMIYSLRNKDVKDAFRTAVRRTIAPG
ncbi:olfactory receptor 9G4-like [Alligator sinensis]|uniref:Olfactory receptor n=1 Tax=Alligator sinensis TaxID=38654 RepID=A0A1U7RML2_ALLSI|nr:olfactory receptor 9G4-like [Alligator sinensis]